MKRYLFLAGILGAILLSGCSSGGGEVSGNKGNVLAEKFMSGQLDYVKEKNIPVIEFPEQKDLADWYSHAIGESGYDTLELIYLKDSGFPSHKLERTMDKAEYYYIGEMKDNEPDGVGLLLMKDPAKSWQTGKMEYCIRYIGSFEKGKYDGYGMLFSLPSAEYDRSTIDEIQKEESDITSDGFNEIYLKRVNYVTYEGEFEKGEQTGEGNQYSYAIPKGDSVSEIEYLSIEVGDFEDGNLHGNAKVYDNGLLLYEGEMKDGKYSGKGKEYHRNGQLCYDGEFKDDEYHGKGTLYDENGNIIYDGKWRYGDYS